MPVPMKDPGAMTGLATLTGRGTLKGEGRTHRPTKMGLLHPITRPPHPHHHQQGRTKCQPVMLSQRVLHRALRLRVLHQITSPMHQTHRALDTKEVDQTIRMHRPLATKLVTKVTKVILVATCTMVLAQLIMATTQDTRVEGQVATRRRLLSQVATSLLLTKAVVLGMVVVHRATKAAVTTTTTTTVPHLPMRAGMGQGGSTNGARAR